MHLKHWNKDHPEYKKEYNFNHREYRNEYSRQWYKDNREHQKQCTKQWARDHREQKNKYNSEYYKTDKGKVAAQKMISKRRGLGFCPIDEYFEDSHAHHISQNFVIYMPSEVHQSIPHNIWTGKNMEQINKLAIEFL